MSNSPSPPINPLRVIFGNHQQEGTITVTIKLNIVYTCKSYEDVVVVSGENVDELLECDCTSI